MNKSQQNNQFSKVQKYVFFPLDTCHSKTEFNASRNLRIWKHDQYILSGKITFLLYNIHNKFHNSITVHIIYF